MLIRPLCPPFSPPLQSLKTDLEGDTIVWELLFYINFHDEISSLGQLRGDRGGHRGYKNTRMEECFLCSSSQQRSPSSPHSQHALGLWLELQNWENCMFSLIWCHLRQCDAVASRRGLQSRLLMSLLCHSPTTSKKWLKSLNSLFEKKNETTYLMELCGAKMRLEIPGT